MLDSETGLLQVPTTPASVDQAVKFRFSITWSSVLPGAPLQIQTEAVKLAALGPVHTPAQDAAGLAPGEPFAPTLYQPRASSRWKLLLGPALLAGIAVPVWKLTTSAPPKPRNTEVETDTRGGGWLRVSPSQTDPGAKQSRQLILYQPSLNAADGRLDFIWKVDDPGVGILLRAKDVGNYYAVKIKVLSHTPSLKLSVDHFAVYLGNEGSHSEKVLVLTGNDPVLHVRLDVAGPSFTMYLQGNAVEYWTDTRLTSGGLGFFEEWRQTADVRSVRMSFPQHPASGGA